MHRFDISVGLDTFNWPSKPWRKRLLGFVMIAPASFEMKSYITGRILEPDEVVRAPRNVRVLRSHPTPAWRRQWKGCPCHLSSSSSSLPDSHLPSAPRACRRTDHDNEAWYRPSMETSECIITTCIMIPDPSAA